MVSSPVTSSSVRDEGDLVLGDLVPPIKPGRQRNARLSLAIPLAGRIDDTRQVELFTNLTWRVAPFIHQGMSTGQPRIQTVRFAIPLAAVHQRCAGNGVLISLVHFQHPWALDSQGTVRRAFGRVRLSIKEKHLRPHDASDGKVMRLWITQWATRDQNVARNKTLTTCGQWIREAGVSLPGWSHAFTQPIDAARQPSKRKAIRFSSTQRLSVCRICAKDCVAVRWCRPESATRTPSSMREMT